MGTHSPRRWSLAVAAASCLVVVYLGLVVFSDARGWELVSAALVCLGGAAALRLIARDANRDTRPPPGPSA